MSKLLLLYSTIIVSLVFMVVPDNDITMGYPFSDMVVSVEYYIYSIFEKFVMIILAYIIWKEADKYEQALGIFFWLMVADLTDLMLSYNSIWFHIGTFPISMNILKCITFGLVILHAWTKKHISGF